jgi:hypothetical protein
MKVLPHLIALLFATSTFAQTPTPLDQPLQEDSVATITCELTQAPRASQVPVFSSNKEADDAKGTYSYKLWLPPGYNADRTKRHPLIFIMDAMGNARMGAMESYFRKNNFVVVMLVEAKNGPWPPIVGNFLAAHDDVVKRVRVDEQRRYATGMSGGARGSSVFVQLRPGFIGLILQGAGVSQKHDGYNTAGIARMPQLRTAMIMGKSDSLRHEAEKLRQLLPRQRYEIFEFDGGHVWAPADVFEQAMTWIEGKGGTAPRPGATPRPTGTPSSFDEFFKKKS